MIDNIKRIPARTPSGIILPGAISALKIDKKRVKKYLEILAKGLFVRCTLKNYEWDKYETTSYVEQRIQADAPIYSKEPIKTIWEKAQYDGYWRNIFAYRGFVIENYSAWILIFYNSHIGSVILTPVASNPEHKTMEKT